MPPTQPGVPPSGNNNNSSSSKQQQAAAGHRACLGGICKAARPYHSIEGGVRIDSRGVRPRDQVVGDGVPPRPRVQVLAPAERVLRTVVRDTVHAGLFERQCYTARTPVLHRLPHPASFNPFSPGVRLVAGCLLACRAIQARSCLVGSEFISPGRQAGRQAMLRKTQTGLRESLVVLVEPVVETSCCVVGDTVRVVYPTLGRDHVIDGVVGVVLRHPRTQGPCGAGPCRQVLAEMLQQVPVVGDC